MNNQENISSNPIFVPNTQTQSTGYINPQSMPAAQHQIQNGKESKFNKTPSNKNKCSVVSIVVTLFLAITLITFTVITVYFLDLINFVKLFEIIEYPYIVAGVVALIALVLSICAIVKSIRIKKNYGYYKGFARAIISLCLSAAILVSGIWFVIYIRDYEQAALVSNELLFNRTLGSYKRTVEIYSDPNYGISKNDGFGEVTLALNQISEKSPEDLPEYYGKLKSVVSKTELGSVLSMLFVNYDTSENTEYYKKLDNPEVIDFIKTEIEKYIAETENDKTDDRNYMASLKTYYDFFRLQEMDMTDVEARIDKFIYENEPDTEDPEELEEYRSFMKRYFYELFWDKSSL